MKPPAYILSGGKSRRFGRDKARVEIEGVPLLRHVAHGISTAVSSITVVAGRQDEYAEMGLRTIGDRQPDRGPLAGIDAALADRGEGWIVVVSCDLLGIRPEWIEVLLERCTEDVQTVLFRSDRWMPFPGMYHTSCHGRVEEHLKRGDLAVWQLVEAVPHRAVPLPPDWEEGVNINRPSDLP